MVRTILVGDCWVWTGGTTKRKRQYGTFSVWMGTKAETKYVHRWMWEVSQGPIPPHHVIHHTCNEPLCINPDHLVCLTFNEHLRTHGQTPRNEQTCCVDECNRKPNRSRGPTAKYCKFHYHEVFRKARLKNPLEPRANPVLITFIDGTQTRYASQKDASEELKVGRGIINKSIREKRPTFKLRSLNVSTILVVDKEPRHAKIKTNSNRNRIGF